MLWFTLFLVFSFTYLMFMIVTYFMTTPIKKSSLISKKTTPSLKWKW